MFTKNEDSVSVTVDKNYLYIGLAMAGWFIAGGVVGVAIANNLSLNVGSYIRGFKDGFVIKTGAVDILA